MAPRYAVRAGLCSRPARDILKLLDAAIYNLIIGNADAHAKNFSLLHKGGAVVLAPLYDLLSTIAYPDLSAKLAMRIANKATLDEIQPHHWDAFADEVDLGAPYIHRRVKQLCEAVLAQLDSADSALHARLPVFASFASVTTLIRDRATKLTAKA